MTLQHSPPQIFVINLKRSADRRAAMTARLAPLQMKYSFFEGVDGSTLDLENLPAYAKTQRRLLFGRDLRKGEVGCLLSHRAVYQHMVDHNIENAIILEDDVFLAPDFPEAIKAIMAQPLKWDMIRFLDSEKVYQRSRELAPLRHAPYTLTRVPIASGGAYGYMLTRQAAQRLLQHMQKNALPVDILHGYVWRTGLEVLAVKPSPVTPDRVIDSTIGDARFDKTLQISGWQRAVYPLTRGWLKLSELVCKRFSYWTSWPRDVLARKKCAMGKQS